MKEEKGMEGEKKGGKGKGEEGRERRGSCQIPGSAPE